MQLHWSNTTVRPTGHRSLLNDFMSVCQGVLTKDLELCLQSGRKGPAAVGDGFSMEWRRGEDCCWPGVLMDDTGRKFGGTVEISSN